VGFIDDKADQLPTQQQAFHGSGAQGFGGNVQQTGRAVAYPLHGLGALDGVEQAVDGHRIGDAGLFEVVHLVFHQRLQGGNDHRQSPHVLPAHQGRQLEGQGFAAARGENGQEGTVVHRGLGRFFLQGLSTVGSERFKTEKVQQPFVDVQRPVAVRATRQAGLVAQGIQDAFHLGVLVQHPGRRDGTHIVAPFQGVDQRQGVGQRHRLRPNHFTHIRMAAEGGFKPLPNQVFEV